MMTIIIIKLNQIFKRKENDREREKEAENVGFTLSSKGRRRSFFSLCLFLLEQSLSCDSLVFRLTLHYHRPYEVFLLPNRNKSKSFKATFFFSLCLISLVAVFAFSASNVCVCACVCINSPEQKENLIEIYS